MFNICTSAAVAAAQASASAHAAARYQRLMAQTPLSTYMGANAASPCPSSHPKTDPLQSMQYSMLLPAELRKTVPKVPLEPLPPEFGKPIPKPSIYSKLKERIKNKLAFAPTKEIRILYMDTRTKLKLPKIPWDKILIASASMMGFMFFLSVLLRSRTIVIATEFIDVIIILMLLALVFVSIVKRYSK